MSYDIRNQKTATAQRTAEVERLNYLALKSRLNKDYEDAQFQRKENERLDIEPAIPIYRSKDDLLADLTTQRQILKFNLKNVMDNDNINKFLGYTFKSPDYAILTNQYWDDIEPKISQYKPIAASFLYEWLNRYFYTKQKMGTELDVVVDPDQFGDLNDISKRASHFIAPFDLTEDEIKRAVREIVSRNYGFAIDPYSDAKDDDIRKFYIQEKVIMPTKRLSPTDWRTIYDKEIRGFDDRFGSYLPATQFAYSGFKKGSELPEPSIVIPPKETTKQQKQVQPGTPVVAPTKEKEGTAQEATTTTTTTPTKKGKPSDDELETLFEDDTINTFDEYKTAYLQNFPNAKARDPYDMMKIYLGHKGYKKYPLKAQDLFAYIKQKCGGGGKKRGGPPRGTTNGNGCRQKLQPMAYEKTSYEEEFGPMFGKQKLTPEMGSKEEPNAYEREFGSGSSMARNYYKFGKFSINKRGLKKKL